MIYQERFTESEIQAVNTLIKECNWATGTDDYLVAYMKLLSDIMAIIPLSALLFSNLDL